jgi:hypothetical protein
MRMEALTRALGRLEDALLNARILEAVLARREAGMARETDAGHSEALARELCRFQGESGSWGESLARTSEALLLLNALTPAAGGVVRAAVKRGVTWMRSLEGRPGAYAEGCDAKRHEAGTCAHVLTGFLSAADPDTDLAGLTSSAPARFGTDADARLGVSCVALQAALRWGFRDDAEERQLAGIRKVIADGLRSTVEAGAVGGYVAAIEALVESRPDDETRPVVAAGINHVLRIQRADGSWPGADTFHVLDLLLRASDAGFADPAIDAAVARAVEMLALLQRSDGSWGRETGPERMLVGWRAFRHTAAAVVANGS